jgi:hypothetical protein
MQSLLQTHAQDKIMAILEIEAVLKKTLDGKRTILAKYVSEHDEAMEDPPAHTLRLHVLNVILESMLHCDWASGRLSKPAVLIESRSAHRRADGHEVRLRGLADHGFCKKASKSMLRR